MYNVITAKGNKGRHTMEVKVDGKRVFVQLYGGNTKEAIAAAAEVKANWKPGMWGEVVDTLGDDWYWISPNGIEHWEI